MNELSIALLHLDDAVRPCRIAAIAEIVDDKGPGTGNRLQNLTRPLEHEMWRAHGDGGVGTRCGKRMSNSNRHQRLAGSALANDDRRSRCFEMLGNTGESQSLSWKRLP